jgi:uncharacterized protein
MNLDNFKDGVRFECQGSGQCCVSHGEYGFVYLSFKDRRLLAKTLGLSLKKFTEIHCRNIDGFWAIKDSAEGADCVFLKNKKCSVYSGRPTQCRTWPFWPDVMTARKWKKDVVQFCPGIGKGKLYSQDEIQKISSAESDNIRHIMESARVSLHHGLANLSALDTQAGPRNSK